MKSLFYSEFQRNAGNLMNALEEEVSTCLRGGKEQGHFNILDQQLFTPAVSKGRG